MEFRKLNTYNRLRIISALEKLIEEKGGKILRSKYDHSIEIKCYAGIDASEELQKKIESLPIITCCGSLHLFFLLNGYYYSFEMDDNPFFPIHYKKIKVNNNGEYIGKRYIYTTDDNESDTLEIHLCYDAIFKVIDDKVIEILARDFLKNLDGYFTKGKENSCYKEKKRVSNYYNNGYHYETIYDSTKCNIYENDYKIR